MIAVIAGDMAAVTPLLNKVSVLRKEESGSTALFLAEMRGEEFLIVTAGYGKANLGAAIAFAMQKFAVETLIGIGDCCCARREVHVFDIAISSFSIQYDVDFAPLGCIPPEIPGVKGTSYLADAALCTLARKLTAKLDYPAFSAAIGTADRCVIDKAFAEKMRRRYHIDCTDILCGVIGEMASVYGVPYVCIEGVSCFADNDAAEMYTTNKKRAQYLACHVVYQMLGILLRPQPVPCSCNGEEPVSCSLDLSSVTNLSAAQIMEIISSSSYTRLSVAENGQPYTVPMAFSYHRDGEKLIFCLYSKNNGQKMHCISENSKVALCFDKGVCDSVSSVVVLGTAKVVHGDYHVTCNAQLSLIQITANQVTGRKYLFCE